MNHFGPKELRAARKLRGWSLRETARRADTTASYICRVELGQQQVSLGVLYRLSIALGLTYLRNILEPFVAK